MASTSVVGPSQAVRNGERVFSSVRAYDAYGLFVEYFSNGVTVDRSPPVPGLVSDGRGLKDVDSQTGGNTITASWLGFVDYESGVVKYEVAVSISSGTANVAAVAGGVSYNHLVPSYSGARFVDVGLRTEVSLDISSWAGLSLTAGQRYFVFVRARNGAGLVSDAVSSDGFVVDVSGPEAVACAPNRTNIAGDGSFEAASPGTVGSSWSVQSGQAIRVASNSTVLGSPDRSTYFLHLSAAGGPAEIVRNVSTVEGGWYRVMFAAAGYPRGQIQGQAGRIVAGTLDRVFSLTDGHVAGYWRLYSFEFRALGPITTLWLSSLGNGVNRGLAVDAVTVNQCSGVAGQRMLALTVRLASGREFAAIDERHPDTPSLSCQSGPVLVPAGWAVAEDDSTVRRVIAEHMWGAACAVVGQGASYGTLSRGANAGGACMSGCSVGSSCMTVGSGGSVGAVCTGGARVVLIERVGVVHVGRPYQNTYSHVQASWMMQDADSGMREYWWAVGTVPGGSQLLPFTSTGTSPAAESYGLRLHHGMRVYVSVTGRNGAGRTTTVVSDPIIIDHTPPVSGTVLDLDGLVSGVDAIVTESAVLRASWTGFADAESGLQWCDVAFGRAPGSQEVYPFTPVLAMGEVGLSTSISGLGLVHGTTYYASVKCANMADLGDSSTFPLFHYSIDFFPPPHQLIFLHIITHT